jgi:cation diffusion facilitator family transporter
VNEAKQQRDTLRRAMTLSVVVGLLMLIGKMAAWWITGSAAILSDAVESVVHVVAVGFAALSLRLSYRPADHKYPYGFERITFFSAGFEGAMIIVAAVIIIYEAAERWIAGVFPANLAAGTAAVAAASLINLVLGMYLVRTGKREQSMIVEANGKHVLTDSWTSFGVVGGLLLVIWTGWAPFDPLLAIAVALNILWSGGQLVWRSAEGLLDYADPRITKRIQVELDRICADLRIRYHEMRFRHSGKRLLIEVHLLFPYDVAVGRAHEVATEVEQRLIIALDEPASVVTHLEAVEGHDQVHNATIRE